MANETIHKCCFNTPAALLQLPSEQSSHGNRGCLWTTKGFVEGAPPEEWKWPRPCPHCYIGMHGTPWHMYYARWHDFQEARHEHRFKCPKEKPRRNKKAARDDGLCKHQEGITRGKESEKCTLWKTMVWVGNWDSLFNTIHLQGCHLVLHHPLP